MDGDSGKGLRGSCFILLQDPLYNSLGEKKFWMRRVMTAKAVRTAWLNSIWIFPLVRIMSGSDQALEGYMLTKETVELDGSGKNGQILIRRLSE